MIKDIVKIKREGKDFLIFSSFGMLISLDKKEYSIFKKYGKSKKISSKHKDFLGKLASYGILEFENYKPEIIKKEYDLSLKDHDSSKPIYPAPVLAHLAITNKCNMACKYCSVRNLHKKICSNELSTSQWKKIISKLSNWGVFQIGFTGGEPTLRKDIIELVYYVHKKGCACNLTTNGWFLDEKLVKELSDAGLKQCQVSLDSHILQIHEKLRGEGSFARVIKSIELLKKKGIAVGIDCVVSKNNIHTIPSFIKWIENNKIKYLTLIKLKKGDLSDADFHKLSPDYSAYSEIIRNVCLRKTNENPNITLDCGSTCNLQQVASIEKFSKTPVSGCPLGHHLICISPNGDIYPCAALLEKKFHLGNILEDDIKLIWNDHLLLKQFRQIKSKINGKCKNCERLDLCRGGCRGISYSASEKMFESDPSCNFINNFQEVKNESTS